MKDGLLAALKEIVANGTIFSSMSGADEQELATPILSLCHGIFTDWSIFSVPFLL